jgi:hypothetical protein
MVPSVFWDGIPLMVVVDAEFDVVKHGFSARPPAVGRRQRPRVSSKPQLGRCAHKMPASANEGDGRATGPAIFPHTLVTRLQDSIGVSQYVLYLPQRDRTKLHLRAAVPGRIELTGTLTVT